MIRRDQCPGVDSADYAARGWHMGDFEFFILLAVAFIALEIVAAFGLIDDNEEANQASENG